MVQDIVCYSPPVFEREPGELDDWDILQTLVAKVAGIDPAVQERKAAEIYLAQHHPRLPRFPAGLSIGEALDRASGSSVPEKIYDVLLRTGKAGDGFGAFPGGLSLSRLQQTPNGMDFGPMQSGQAPDVLATPDKKIHLAPAVLIDDLDRLETAINEGFYAPDQLTLIGRCSVRSNNSWMHNIRRLAKGPQRCTAMINPADAQRHGIRSGELIKVRSRTAEIVITAEVSDEMGPGVVCIPHGFSEKLPGAKLSVAHSLNGANVNLLHDHAVVDKPSGGASFSTTRVTLERVELAEHRGQAQS